MPKRPLSFNQKLLAFMIVMLVVLVGAIAVIAILARNNQDSIAQMVSGFGEGERDETSPELEEAERLIKEHPKEAEGYVKRGDFFQADGDYTASRKDYSTAISLKPENAQWYHKRALVQDELGRSIQDLNSAIELTPDKQYYFDRAGYHNRSENYGKALSDLKEAEKLGYSKAAVECCRGVIYVQMRDFDNAIVAYKSSISTVPSASAKENNWRDYYSQKHAYRELFKIYVVKADFISAEKQVGLWMAEKPKTGHEIEQHMISEAFERGAAFFKGVGNPRKERAAIISLIEIDSGEIEEHPQKYYPHIERGSHYLKVGRTADARNDFEKAVELYKAKEKPTPTTKIARVMNYLGDKSSAEDQIKQMIFTHYEFISKHPRDAHGYHRRGGSYFQLEQFDLALKDFQTAQTLGSEDAGYRIAKVLIRKKKYQEAIDECNRGLLVNKEGYRQSRLFSALAQGLELSGRHREAIEAATKAIELQPFYGPSYFYRAKAYEGIGDTARAKTNMIQAVALGNTDEDDTIYSGI
jgi:hypothetical protein